MKRKAASTAKERHPKGEPAESVSKVQEYSPTEWGPVATYAQTHSHRPAELAPGKMIARILAGLPVSELDELQSLLALPMERLAPKLGMSKATLHRRRQTGRLGTDESDKVMRFARIFGQASDVFQNEEDARRWLNAPQVGLGGAIPLDYAETEAGAREVERLLTRIEYGVYS